MRPPSALRCLALAALLALLSCGADPDVIQPVHTRKVSRWDWQGYGYDAQHTFAGRTTLAKSDIARLALAWSFPTGDAVTATPTVVRGTVFAGSWDGWFYAVNLRTGRLRWKFHLHPQPAVKPVPGVKPRPYDSDGGLVTSSAWFEPGSGHRPDLILFGGGYTLYALDARTGRKVWAHNYTGRPDRPPEPTKDPSRIFSSPIVVDGKVIVGVSTDGADGRRGYVAAASLATGRPRWIHETDRDDRGRVRNDGCGNIWSSASVAPDLGLIYFDSSDCHFANAVGDSESVFALRITDGTRAWIFRPPRRDTGCDYDFGASVNVGLAAGATAFVGVGGKDGTYYSLDPKTGALRWKTNVVFGGVAGGFLGTTAYDGERVYGATGIGDLGNFATDGTAIHCAPADPRDTSDQEPSAHAFDASTGAVAWQTRKSRSFGPTTVAGGMTFSGLVLDPVMQIRDASTGDLLGQEKLPALCWSGIATAGNAIVLGTGASHQGAPDGILVFTPGGVAPVVPRS
jgi:polyvinyl alcohol dehydrogenase (cytochrome)